MSRFFFHILNDPGTGLEFDTSVAVGDLSVDLDGSPSGLSFTQVNDGYYFEYTVSGLYTIKISGVAQDEFTTIPLIATEDNVDTTMLQSVKGYIYSSGGYLRVYTDGSSAILHAGDVVDDLTTGGTSVPLSAAQGVILYNMITQGALVPGAGQPGSGNLTTRTVYNESKQAAATANAAAGIFTVYENDDTNGDFVTKAYFSYYRARGEKYLIAALQAYTDAAITFQIGINVDGNQIASYEFGSLSQAIGSYKNFVIAANMDAESVVLNQAITNDWHLVEITIYVNGGTGSVFAKGITVMASGG